MAHKHPVFDTDTHFVVDPLTRAITNAQNKKVTLMQNDHNAEVFTFELPRHIEGHDMTLCNQVEIHFKNVNGTTRETSSGIYEVQDFGPYEHDNQTITFSWLISQTATMHPGGLSFVIVFECTEDGETTYRWSCGINSSISIIASINNDEVIEEILPDIVTQWKDEIFSKNLAYEAALDNGFEGSILDWLASLKGEKGDTGLYVGDEEPEGHPYFWFDTSGHRDTFANLVLTNGEGGSVFVDISGRKYSIEGATLDSETVTKGTYNFDII